MSLPSAFSNIAWFLFVFVVVINELKCEATSSSCNDGEMILIDAMENHSGFIASPGYPDQIISSFCNYEIKTSISKRVYVEFTEFDLPTCKDAFIELLSQHEDEDEPHVCLGNQDQNTKECEFCNKAKPVQSHSTANIVTIMVKFNVNSTKYKGFKMEWRSGEYGSFYNWVEDPINNHTGLVVGVILGIVGFLGLIVAPFVVYRIRRRRSRQGDRFLVEQQDDDDNEHSL